MINGNVFVGPSSGENILKLVLNYSWLRGFIEIR